MYEGTQLEQRGRTLNDCTDLQPVNRAPEACGLLLSAALKVGGTLTRPLKTESVLRWSHHFRFSL